MLRLPPFVHHAPASLAEALELLADLRRRGASAKVIAGGTDLLPNMKHEVTTPEHLVALHRLPLSGIEVRDGSFHLGALTTLQAVADDPAVVARLPALAQACSQIAGPQHRRMGTLGGNLCLDTRCLYINQSYFWRQALGFCLKKDGSVCHVVAGGKNCVAAASNDSALPLLLYGAEVELASVRGRRWLPLAEFFVADGVHNTLLESDEVVTWVRVPVPTAGTKAAFEKLRLRASIDFALVNVAALVETDEEARLVRLQVAVGALGARPKVLELASAVTGKRLDRAVVELAAKKAFAACRPLTNIATDPDWRRAMIPVLVRRALARLAGDRALRSTARDGEARDRPRA